MVRAATTTFGMQNSPRISATSSPLRGSSTALFLPLTAGFKQFDRSQHHPDLNKNNANLIQGTKHSNQWKIEHLHIPSFCNNSSFPHVVWIYITSFVAGFLSANHEGNEWSRDISATQGFWQNQAGKQENCNAIMKGGKTMEETRKRTW